VYCPSLGVAKHHRHGVGKTWKDDAKEGESMTTEEGECMTKTGKNTREERATQRSADKEKGAGKGKVTKRRKVSNEGQVGAYNTQGMRVTRATASAMQVDHT